MYLSHVSNSPVLLLYFLILLFMYVARGGNHRNERSSDSVNRMIACVLFSFIFEWIVRLLACLITFMCIVFICLNMS